LFIVNKLLKKKKEKELNRKSKVKENGKAKEVQVIVLG